MSDAEELDKILLKLSSVPLDAWERNNWERFEVKLDGMLVTIVDGMIEKSGFFGVKKVEGWYLHIHWLGGYKALQIFDSRVVDLRKRVEEQYWRRIDAERKQQEKSAEDDYKKWLNK